MSKKWLLLFIAMVWGANSAFAIEFPGMEIDLNKEYDSSVIENELEFWRQSQQARSKYVIVKKSSSGAWQLKSVVQNVSKMDDNENTRIIRLRDEFQQDVVKVH